MKYKNALAVNTHICGTRVVGPNQEFELSLAEAQDPLVRKLLSLGHIAQVVRDGEPLLAFSSSGRRFLDNRDPAAHASKEKTVAPPTTEADTTNLNPIVDTILAQAEATIEATIETAIEQEIQRALHVTADVTPTSVTVDVPLGAADAAVVEPADTSVSAPAVVEENSTQKDVITQKTTPKQAKKPASKSK